MVTFLKQADIQVALTFMQLVAFQQTSSQYEAEFPRMHPPLKFENGTSGGITISTNFDKKYDVHASLKTKLNGT